MKVAFECHSGLKVRHNGFHYIRRGRALAVLLRDRYAYGGQGRDCYGAINKGIKTLKECLGMDTKK